MKLSLSIMLLAAALMIGCSEDRLTAPEDGLVAVTGTVVARSCLWLTPDTPYYEYSGKEATVIFTKVESGATYERKTGTDSRFSLRLEPGQYTYEFYSYDWWPTGPLGVTISSDTSMFLWGTTMWSTRDSLSIVFYYLDRDSATQAVEIGWINRLNEEAGFPLDVANGRRIVYDDQYPELSRTHHRYLFPIRWNQEPWKTERFIEHTMHESETPFPERMYVDLDYTICMD